MEKVEIRVRVEKLATSSSQYRIWTPDGVYFQSYDTIIAFAPYLGKKVLDRESWDNTDTTARYRNQFLGETGAETLAKIKSGEYLLEDLN